MGTFSSEELEKIAKGDIDPELEEKLKLFKKIMEENLKITKLRELEKISKAMSRKRKF